MVEPFGRRPETTDDDYRPRNDGVFNMIAALGRTGGSVRDRSPFVSGRTQRLRHLHRDFFARARRSHARDRPRVHLRHSGRGIYRHHHREPLMDALGLCHVARSQRRISLGRDWYGRPAGRGLVRPCGPRTPPFRSATPQRPLA